MGCKDDHSSWCVGSSRGIKRNYDVPKLSSNPTVAQMKNHREKDKKGLLSLKFALFLPCQKLFLPKLLTSGLTKRFVIISN